MRGAAITGVAAVAVALTAPVSLAGQSRSSGLAHEITHVVQQQGSGPAVLSLAGGARLVLPPGSVDGARITFRRVGSAAMPCRHEGFDQIGDSLVVDGSLRGTRAGVRVSIAANPGRARSGHRLVLVAEREPTASVGGNQTETVGASRTLTVGGNRTEARAGTFDGRYVVTSARHDARAGRIEAELAADGRFRSLHFGWLVGRHER